MLDQYNLAGNAQALAVAVGIAKWTKTNVDQVLARGGQDLWQQVLGTEWGGMNGEGARGQRKRRRRACG